MAQQNGAGVGLLQRVNEARPSGPGGVFLLCLLVLLWPLFAVGMAVTFGLFVGLAVFLAPLLLLR